MIALDLFRRAQGTAERWKYSSVQGDDEDIDAADLRNKESGSTSGLHTDNRWLSGFGRPSSRGVLRLMLALVIVLLIANLASLHQQLRESITSTIASVAGDVAVDQSNDIGDVSNAQLDTTETGNDVSIEIIDAPTDVNENVSTDLEPSTDTPNTPSLHDETDWSRYAYCQYVTNPDYLCNSLMILERLHSLGSKADRIMMYPDEWRDTDFTHEARLLRKARDEYNVKLVPIHVQHLVGELTWADSFTKLLAFNQTQYDRVISLDSDATVLQPMDELFLMPSAPVAMPRAYWLDDNSLSSQLVVIEPSEFEFKRIQHAFDTRNATDFDMEIVNNLYAKDCMVIPHRKYDLLTGEFRSKNHVKYLGSEEEVWDAEKVLAEAKFLHFSDWPFPKPWLTASDEAREQVQPACQRVAGSLTESDPEGGMESEVKEDCTNRRLWNGFYADFTRRREVSFVI